MVQSRYTTLRLIERTMTSMQINEIISIQVDENRTCGTKPRQTVTVPKYLILLLMNFPWEPSFNTTVRTLSFISTGQQFIAQKCFFIVYKCSEFHKNHVNLKTGF